MRRCFFTSIVLLILLAGCNSNSTRPVQFQPTVTMRRIETQVPDDPNAVAPQGMTRAEVREMLDQRSKAAQEALQAKERQERLERQAHRPRSGRVDIYWGDPFFWPYGYCGPYYYGPYWPWHRHHGGYRRHW